MKGIERLGLLRLEIEAKRHGRLSLRSSTTGGNNGGGDCHKKEVSDCIDVKTNKEKPNPQ